MFWILQDQRALQVFRAVQSAGEAKMALQIRSGRSKDIQHIARRVIGLRHHEGYYTIGEITNCSRYIFVESA
jgi:hypothetical protein